MSPKYFVVVVVVALAGMMGSVGARAGNDTTPYRDCPDCPEMIHLPGGSFQMGDSGGDGDASELPVHAVTIRPFSIGRFEVTFDEWESCMKGVACGRVDYDESWGRGRRPVTNILWDDAQRFVAWLSAKTGKSYRLPSEAEWEYAARAGSTTPYPWGNNLTPGLANCHSECGETFENTSPAGSFKPNPFGLFDMHGNVWEWVQDCWADTYKDAPTDGTARSSGDCKSNIARGGSFLNYSPDLRSSSRVVHPFHIRFTTIGFRVVRTD